MFEEKAYAKDLEALRAKLGLNRPIYIQYVIWLGQLVQGDLGESLWTKRPVLEELMRRLPVSAELGAMAIVFGLCIALPIGVLAAIRQDTMKDYAAQPGDHWLSMPGFWKATVIIVFTSIWFGWAPPLQFTPFTQNPWQHVSQFLLPAILLGIGSSAGIMRLTRALMLEGCGKTISVPPGRGDARKARGGKARVEERGDSGRHHRRDPDGRSLANGTVIMETIFGLPGMGRFLVDAMNQRDYPVVQGVILLAASIIVLVNLLVDMTYAYLDPRIRYQ